MNDGYRPDPGHFERLYERDPDPWKFATSDYERGKYAATLAALSGERRFRHAFEIGCSIGVLTAQLAERCDAVLAVDVAPVALEAARKRCARLPHVRIEPMVVPGEWPTDRFDLIVFSEVLYYLGIDGIRRAAEKTLGSLDEGGTVLLCNWHGPTDGACPGNEAAEHFIAACAPRLGATYHHRAERYRLDVLG
jgi:SAM-dependent methyltransferase